MTDPELRPTRISLYAASVGMAVFTPFAALASFRLATWQLALAAVTCACAWLLGRTGSRAVLFAVAVLIPALYGPIVHESGGANSPTFAWLVAMPLGLVVIFRGQQRALTVGVVSTAIIAGLVCALDDTPVEFIVLRAVQVAVASALAWVGSSAFASSARRERAAADKLADSELRREKAERTIYLVRLATALAHEINNPLGFMKSNIELLLDGPVESEDRAALIESLQGIDRIHSVIEELEEIAGQPHAAKASPGVQSAERVIIDLPRI